MNDRKENTMQRFAVLGLGRFGFYLVKTLFEKGHDVIAIDSKREIVQGIKDFCSQAVVADATDKEALISLGVGEVDDAIVAIGQPMAASILATLYLREMGIGNIVVKAISTDHAKILEKIGANEVIFAEREMAIKVANSLTSHNIIDFLPLAPEYGIMEVAPPVEFIGKTLGGIDLRKKYKVQVVAIKQLIPEKMIMVPGADFVIKDSDVLVVMGEDKNLEALQKKKL